MTLTPAAAALPPGLYASSLLVSNQNTGAVQSRGLLLGVTAVSMADDFEPDVNPSQWSAFGGPMGAAQMAAGYGGYTSPANALWFGGTGDRYAATIPLNTKAGGQISFALRIAQNAEPNWSRDHQGDSDGVTLEFSTDLGGSWVPITNYLADVYHDWTQALLAIPTSARTGATIFRWRQARLYDEEGDNWALDNVAVATAASAPVLVTCPPNETVPLRGAATLAVSALGGQPITYQWRLNGGAISGASSSSLVIPSFGVANQGTYSVVCSNKFGVVSSPAAILNVVNLPGTADPAAIGVLKLNLDSFKVSCTGSTGTVYVVQGADVLGGAWTNLATLVSDSAGACSYVDKRPALSTARFYRVVAP